MTLRIGQRTGQNARLHCTSKALERLQVEIARICHMHNVTADKVALVRNAPGQLPKWKAVLKEPYVA